jgi:hypothetical protein
LPWPFRETAPLNDFPGFAQPYFSAACFPTLFFSKNGDPYGLTPHTSKNTFLEKVRYLIKYSERDENDKLVCRFSKHPRFIAWVIIKFLKIKIETI